MTAAILLNTLTPSAPDQGWSARADTGMDTNAPMGSLRRTATGRDRGSIDANGEPPPDILELSSVLGEILAVAEVSFVLLAAGLLAVAVWLAAPARLWVILAGSLVLAGGIFGLVTLPLSGGAVFLLTFGAASLLMEVLAAPGLLLHAAGGAVALIMAGLCLHHPWSGAHPLVVVPTTLIAAAGTWLAARRSWRAIRSDPFAPSSELVGRETVVLDADQDVGYAVVAGQLWVIHATSHDLRPGCAVRVTRHSTESLTVQRLPSRSRR
jgi:membrane-bound ClpP family serine protease